MRTRKTFTHEDSIYEGVVRVPEPRENHHKDVDLLNDCYECYPEKQSLKTVENGKFEGVVDLPLGEEYKLRSGNYNYSDAS